MEKLLNLCERTVEMALDLGADEAEAFAVTGDSVNVQLQKNDLQIARSTRSDGLGVRLFKNTGLGFAYVNSFTEQDVRESVELALGIAHASPRDSDNGLPDPSPLAPREGIMDRTAFGVDEAVRLALEMLSAARGTDPRVTVDSGELSGRRGTKAIASSRGVRAVEEASGFHCVIMGMARDDKRVSSFDYQFDCSRKASGIDPVAVASKFAGNVVSTLGAVKGENFVGPILLAPKAAAEIVSYPVTYAARASSVQKDMSKFSGRIGERVASPLLTVVDDSTLPGGMSTTAFDREGLPPKVLPLIENGVLRSFLYDTYTARREGRVSTGHAGGGASSVPTVGTTNVVWSEGATPLADIISGIDKGIAVNRFSGNVDPVSGDFSGSVKGGHMIRGGRLAEPLCGTMIAGNVFDLMLGASAVSVEREVLFDETIPHIVLEGVSVSTG